MADEESALKQALAVPRAASARDTAGKTTFAKRAISVLANEWATAAVIFLFTRTIALLSAYVGVSRLIAVDPARNKGWLAELALMWDAAWYAGIAQHSYTYDPASAGGTNVAFAPLFPFLMNAVATILHWLTFGWNWGNDSYGTLIAAGFLISNISFFAALVFLLRLLAPRLGAVGAAMVALALASLPTAFFFSALYTEGLFLMLVLASLLVAHSKWRQKWLCAGLLGMLASLTRFTGVLLLAVLLVDYLVQRNWQWRKVRADLLWLGLIPLGVGVYTGFLWWRFGTPFALSDSMLKGWNHQASFFLLTYWESAAKLWQSVAGLVPVDKDPVLYYGNGSRLYLILDLAMPLALLVGAFAARKKLLASEWVWLVLGIVYPLSTNITFSMARYVLPLWPGLIWLGTLRKGHRWVAVGFIAISLMLLAWCSYIYANAKWIG